MPRELRRPSVCHGGKPPPRHDEVGDIGVRGGSDEVGDQEKTKVEEKSVTEVKAAKTEGQVKMKQCWHHEERKGAHLLEIVMAQKDGSKQSGPEFPLYSLSCPTLSCAFPSLRVMSWEDLHGSLGHIANRSHQNSTRRPPEKRKIKEMLRGR